MSGQNPAAVVVAATVLVVGGGVAVWITQAPRATPPLAQATPTAAASAPTPAEPSPTPAEPTDTPAPQPPASPSPQATAAPDPSPVDAELEDLFASLGDGEADAEREIALPPQPELRPVELRTSDAREAALHEASRAGAAEVARLREQLAQPTPAAVAPAAAAATYTEARAALAAGRVDDALAGFAAAADAGADWSPELEPIRAAAQPWRAQADGAPGHLRWRFAPGADLEDFQTWGPAQAEVATDELAITTPRWFRFGLITLGGRWHQARVSLTLGDAEPAPALGFAHDDAGYALTFNPDAITLHDLAARHDEQPLVVGPRGVPADALLQVDLALGEAADALQVSVRAGGDVVFDASLPWRGSLQLSLGTLAAGQARFRSLEVTGQPDPVWLAARQADAAEDAWDALREQELARRDDGQLARVFAPTSAEDEVGLAGVPEAAQARVAEARAMLRSGDDDLAPQYLQQASERSDDYAAAHVLHARAQLAHDPLSALALCDQALLAVAGFYEAHACRAEALRRLGRLKQAREALERALTQRADFAPAWVTRAWLALADDDAEGAREAVTIAGLLDPDDPGVAADVRALEAWLAGPPGLEPFTPAAGLRVYTTSKAKAKQIAEQVLAARARCEQLLAPLLPAVAAPPLAPARVIVFHDPAAYARWTRVTQGRRAAAPWGHFDAASAQLTLLETDGLLDPGHILRREAAQQWLQSRGVTLPARWASQGLADLVAGVARPDRPLGLSPELHDQLRLFATQRHRALALFDLMHQTGDWRYAVGDLRDVQAWLVWQWLLEDPDLRPVARDYLRLLAAGGHDPQRDRAELFEQAFMATFYEADLVGAQPRWRAWLDARCAKLAGQ